MSSHDRDCTGHESLATRSLVINTVGLLNDYALHSGLQAQEIRLGSPDCFPRERRGLGTGLALPLLILGNDAWLQLGEMWSCWSDH